MKKNKVVLWAFYGTGKSTVANGTSVVDFDSKKFQFIGVDDKSMHSSSNEQKRFVKDPMYPENYIRAVKEVNAEVVLVNCEVELLNHFENVILYYPGRELKEEYLERYRKRGDHPSFVQFMKEEFDGMIHTLTALPYPKYVSNEKNKYLSDVFKGGKINMEPFLIKKDLSNLIERAREFDIQGYGFFSDYESFSGDEIAQQIFEGEIKLSIEELQEKVQKKQIEYENSFKGIYVYEDEKKFQAVEVVRGYGKQEREIWVRERKETKDGKTTYYGFPIFDENGKTKDFEKFQKLLESGYQKTEERFEVGTIEKRGLDGFSHQEAVDIVMDAIACGVLQLRHGEVQPYSYGFECIYPDVATYIPGYNISPFEFPERIVRNIELNKREYHAFVNKPIQYSDISLHVLKQEVEAKHKLLESVRITPYETTCEYKEHQANRYARGLIANDRYIDSGYAVDGIIRGDCHGDYSSITTGSQNSWMEASVALRGFCLDYIHDCLKEGRRFPYLDKIDSYYQSKGLDLNDEKQVRQWCAEHPNQCYSDKYLYKEIEQNEELKNKLKVFQESSVDGQYAMDLIDQFMKEAPKELSGQDLVDSFSEYMKRNGIDIRVVEAAELDEYYCDFDIGLLTVTFYINSDDRGHLMDGFEIWDQDGSYYGNYNIDEIAKKIEELQAEISDSDKTMNKKEDELGR